MAYSYPIYRRLVRLQAIEKRLNANMTHSKNMADMQHFELDYERSVERKSRSNLFMFLFFSAIMSSALFYAYFNDMLPHYTLNIDNGVYTFVRDDPKYLAEQAALEAEANRQIYRINGQEVTQQEYELALQQQQQQAENQQQQSHAQIQVQPDTQSLKADTTADGQVRKCLDSQNHPVYQTQPCETNGYKTAKVLTQNDGNVSQSQTYNYKQAEQRQEALTNYEVDGRPVTKAEFERVQANNRQIERDNAARKATMCKAIEQRREWIRSQQRNNSTQYWRDEYTASSKEWQDKCLGWSQAWSS